MTGSTMRSRKKSKDTLKQMKMRAQQSEICGTLGEQISRKCIVLQAYLKKWEKAQANNLTSQLKEFEKNNKQRPNRVEGKK